jgi:hypothetical protein
MFDKPFALGHNIIVVGVFQKGGRRRFAVGRCVGTFSLLENSLGKFWLHREYMWRKASGTGRSFCGSVDQRPPGHLGRFIDTQVDNIGE